jgi:hypothetical protein
MFDVHQFLFRFDRPFFWPAAGLKPKPTQPMFIIMFPGFQYQAAGNNG